MSEYSYTFCGIELRVVMNEEPAEPASYDHPGCDAVFELDEIIMPDGDRCGTEYFSPEYVKYIEEQVKKQVAGELDDALTERAIERHQNREEWRHARRPQP